MSPAVFCFYLAFCSNLFCQPTAATTKPCEQGFCAAPEEEERSQMNIPKSTLIETVGKVLTKVKRSAMAWRSSGESNMELVNNLEGQLLNFCCFFSISVGCQLLLS